jgi:hypothetical protein
MFLHGKGVSKMQNNSHGIISFFLILSAIATALGAVFPRSYIMALMYLGVVLLSFLLVLVSYCAKCPSRISGCAHVFPGKLTVYLTKRKEGPYSFSNILMTLLAIVAILAIPQLWLMYNIPSLVLFWVLIIIAVLEIVFLVCPDCSNRYCFLCSRKCKPVK